MNQQDLTSPSEKNSTTDINLRDIKGFFDVVDSVPTHTPRSFWDSIKISSAGSLYIYDYKTNVWRTYIIGSDELSDLTDVVIASPENNDLIAYDDDDNKWKNKSVSEVGAEPAFNTLTESKGGTGESSFSKGDLLGGNGSGLTKLTVGTDGKYLKADSGEATGLKWDTPASTGFAQFFRAHLSADFQTDASASVDNKIPFDHEDFDPGNAYDNETNYRYTPGVAGYYYVYGQMTFDDRDANCQWRLMIRKNANTWISYAYHKTGSSTDIENTLSVSSLVYLDADDFVEIWCGQNTSIGRMVVGDALTSTYFYAFRIF